MSKIRAWRHINARTRGGGNRVLRRARTQPPSSQVILTSGKDLGLVRAPPTHGSGDPSPVGDVSQATRTPHRGPYGLNMTAL
jgi:hypothetical protein